MNPAGHAANLTPFKSGNRAPRRSADVDKAIRLARKHSPEAIQTAIECMRDAEATWPERLKAVQLILNAGLPKDPAAIDRALDENRGSRYLEVVFVSPDGSRSNTPNFDGTRQVPQAGGDAAKVVDEQPINVTPQRLPPPRMVRDAEPETTVLPSQAPRQG